MEFDVFLSYSRKDSEMMRRVRDDLRAAGLRVWTDETLEPGTETWEAEVEGAIRASQILVVLLSPDAHASEWVRNEITLADALQRRIIPVLLRGQQGESIPLRLIASQWIDARANYDHASEMLITAIRNHGARSHQAPTLRMSRRHSQADTPEAPQEAAQEVAQAGGVRIPLIVGVVATMAMFALVALAVILANPATPTITPEATVEPTFTPETPPDSPASQASPEAQAAVELRGQIAFVSNRDDELYDIFVLDLARGRTQLLWTNPYTEAYVAWSPDGSLLTFTSWTEPDFAGDIYTLRTSDSRLSDLTESDNVEDRFARWSPDGTQLVYESVTEGNIDLFVMNADGSEQHNISNAPDSWEREPAWSPLGDRIAFSSDRGGLMQLWLMNPDGSDPVNLSTQSGHFGQAAWSPDGTRIAYSYCASPSPCDYEETAGTEDNWDIWVMNADGSNPLQMTDNPTNDVAPAWSPDGTRIAFVSYRDGNAEIYVMNADGSGQVNVSNNPAEDYGPAWQP